MRSHERPKFEPGYKEKPEKIGEESEEELSPESTPEKIYSKKFTGKLEDVLKHEFKGEDGKEKIILKDIVDKHLEKFTAEKFSQRSTEEQSEAQVNLLKDLAEQISKISDDSWSINFQQAIENNALNCSNCASLTGLILEKVKEEANLQNIEYGSPCGHALNVVTLADGRVFYVDSRNNAVEDLEINQNTKIEDKEGLKVYKINELKGRIGYKIIPALSVKEGILISYLGNIKSSYSSAKGKLPNSMKERPEKERKEFRDGAKRVCKEKGLFDKDKREHLTEMLESLEKAKILNEYIESKEFEKEIKRWEEDEQEIQGAKRRLGEIFDNHKNDRERFKKTIAIFESDDEVRQILESNLIDGDKIRKSLEQCLDIKDREEFINKAISSLEPLFKLRENNPEAFEELSGIMFVELSGFTKLNKIFSYGEGKDLIHIHLASIKELIKKVGIDGIMDLMRDGLEKLAEKVEANEKIDRITATSWIIAKKSTRERLKNLGFTLEGEISPEDKQKYHRDDPREIHRASMTREEFLGRYLEK